MADGNDPEYSSRLRPRKSGALSDISNRVLAGIADATKKVGGKKRKLSNAPSEQDSKVKKEKQEDSVVLTENPLSSGANSSSSSNADHSADKSKSSEEGENSAGAAAAASEETSDAGRDSSNTRSASKAKKEVSKEKENKTSTSQDPNRIRRSFPLRMRSNDPSQCMGLLDDMYALYYEHEENFRSQPYMHTQSDLNNKMRSILVDWLVEVHHKFKLQTVTLYLCVNIIDRFLSRVSILRGKLQLVGVTALFIACKFEEVYPPEVRDFVYITDNAYTKEQVLRMEMDILTELNYEVLVPTAYHFLVRYLECIRASERTRLVASFYAERSLQEAHMLDVKPREYAAAAVYASLMQQNCEFEHIPAMKKAPVWHRLLQEESNLEVSDFVECARRLVKHAGEEPQTTSKRKLVAAKKKYSSENFQNVAALPLPTI